MLLWLNLPYLSSEASYFSDAVERSGVVGDPHQAGDMLSHAFDHALVYGVADEVDRVVFDAGRREYVFLGLGNHGFSWLVLIIEVWLSAMVKSRLKAFLLGILDSCYAMAGQ